jgi:phosphatidylinositol-4,5-bisphosphate 4-phosphatase
MAAFRSLEGNPTTITVAGQTIKVNLQINAFNFGVNAGAVGKLSWAPGVKLGLERQYKHNVRAFQGLKAQFEAVVKDLLPNDPRRFEMEMLFHDIDLLMADKKAYLAGGNQYEIGAKILNLTFLMNQAAEGGTEGAFNCMSGKDRTGVMDAVSRAFAVMRQLNGKFPSHNELAYNSQIQEQFREIFSEMLQKYGGLEVTEINTGALGFKVGGEANLYGLEKEIFKTIQGLSKTTSA